MSCTIMPATISAITALVGMPRVSIGTNDACAPALLADSGPATPSTAPWPNSSGRLEIFFSTAYDANADNTAPPPGSTPKNEPIAVPRTTAGAARLSSVAVGIRVPTRLVNTSRLTARLSRFAMISPKPKIPIAIATKGRPSASSGMPKVKRSAPELTSVPIMPSIRPSATIANALITEPLASTTAAIRPTTISAKYSVAPKWNATSASIGAKAAIRKVATQPAKNEPRAAMLSAAPARPFFAI